MTDVHELQLDRIVHNEHITLVRDIGNSAVTWCERTGWQTMHAATIAIDANKKIDSDTIRVVAFRPYNSQQKQASLYVIDEKAWNSIEEGYSPSEILSNKLRLGNLAITTAGQYAVSIDKYGYISRSPGPHPNATTLNIDCDGAIILDDQTKKGRIVTANWAHSIVLPHQQTRPLQWQRGLRLVINESA